MIIDQFALCLLEPIVNLWKVINLTLALPAANHSQFKSFELCAGLAYHSISSHFIMDKNIKVDSQPLLCLALFSLAAVLS